MSNTQIVPFAVKSLAELDNVDVSKFNIPTLGAYAAEKLGKTFPKGTRPSTKWLLEKGGVSKDALKPIRKELDQLRAASYKGMHNVNLLFAGSNEYRKRMRFRRNKKGDVLATTSYTKSGVISTETYDAMKEALAAANETIAKLKALPA